jgi:hypothetical protein
VSYESDGNWKNGFYKQSMSFNAFIFIVVPVYIIYLINHIQEDQAVTVTTTNTSDSVSASVRNSINYLKI